MFGPHRFVSTSSTARRVVRITPGSWGGDPCLAGSSFEYRFLESFGSVPSLSRYRRVNEVDASHQSMLRHSHSRFGSIWRRVQCQGDENSCVEKVCTARVVVQDVVADRLGSRMSRPLRSMMHLVRTRTGQGSTVVSDCFRGRTSRCVRRERSNEPTYYSTWPHWRATTLDRHVTMSSRHRRSIR